MDNLYSYTCQVNNTYFEKIRPTTIDEVNVGDIFYVEIESPLNYGVRTWAYFAKLFKKTDKFFDAAYYCEANFGIGRVPIRLRTDNLSKKEKRIKRFAKSRIIEVFTASTHSKTETVEYWTNVAGYADGSTDKEKQ